MYLTPLNKINILVVIIVELILLQPLKQLLREEKTHIWPLEHASEVVDLISYK